MESLWIILTALLFFIIGRWSRIPHSQSQGTIDSIVESARSVALPKKPPGVIQFRTQEDFEAEKNGDKALEEHWIKSGIKKVLDAN